MHEMKSKIVGVTMGEESRQEHIKQLQQGAELFPFYENDNPFDPNAIKLFADAAKQKPLGYIKKELARDLREQRAKGWEYTFKVEEVTGKEKHTKGCNIVIEAKKVQE